MSSFLRRTFAPASGCIARLLAAIAVVALAAPSIHAATPFYVLDLQGKEAEASVLLPGIGGDTRSVDKGGPPAFLSFGTIPSPTTYGTWSAAPSTFAFSRGTADRFSVGLGRIGATAGLPFESRFLSVIRYEPAVADFAVTLKVDPLELFFGFTGNPELATPQIDHLSLTFGSRFGASWFDPATSGFKSFGSSYVSGASIFADTTTPLSTFVASLIADADGSVLSTFNDATAFVAGQGFGAASITAPAVERVLSFRDVPAINPGNFASLYLVYEMSVSGVLATSGASTRSPFMFALAGDPIALDAGDFRPSIVITPVPEPSALALWAAGVLLLVAACRRRSRREAGDLRCN